MHIHILGICGTFMGGLALLASELNHTVTGADQNVYPPMSTQLNKLGIKIYQGYADLTQLSKKPRCIIVGNVMHRGIPLVEELLDRNLPFVSGPAWLAEQVLKKRHVLAVSGTHGKTTASSMLAWVLEYAKLSPGFLIGGVPNNFGISARLGKGKYFVVEADEYDSAFFDKRSKFVHYRPRTLVINNIEFDHADIFADLKAIQQQFHHLVRTIPSQGLIVHPSNSEAVNEVLKMGCWTKRVTVANPKSNSQTDWHANQISSKGDQFTVCFNDTVYGTIRWGLLGNHNIQNALGAIAAAEHIEVDPKIAIEALCHFQGVKRRMEMKLQGGVTVYDDFAHHPTAILTTLAGLRAKVGKKSRVLAVIDIRSNTMRLGHFQKHLALSVQEANHVYFFKSPDITWDVHEVWSSANKPGGVYSDLNQLLDALLAETEIDDHVIFMSNGGFGGIQTEFLEQLPQ